MLYQDIYTKKHWLFNCRAEEQAVTPRWTRARNVPQGPTSRQHGLDVHRDQTDNSDFARRYSRRGYIRFYGPARRNAPEKPTTRCFYILFFLERSLRDVILCLAHLNARETDGDLLAHDSDKPKRRHCISPSKRRTPTPRVSRAPSLMPASAIWSASWPVRPPATLSTPRRPIMNRTASPSKEAAV